MDINEKEYKIAFAEIDDILHFSDEDVFSRIPKSFIRFIKENKDEDYISNINCYLEIDEQDVSPKAKALMALIYRNYIADSEEKKEFEKKDKIEFQKKEDEKREKYNPDEIFKNIKSEIEPQEIVTDNFTKENENLETEKSLILPNKNIFQKLFIKIKKFLKKC